MERVAIHGYRPEEPPSIRLRTGAPAATLALTGDVGLHHWSDGLSLEQTFGRVRWMFESADFSVVNLETVLTSHDQPAGRIGRFLKAPPRAVATLEYLGIKAVSSANNHALDFGRAGLAECGRVLRQAGIGWCGIDDGNPEADRLFMREVNGVVIGVLAATDHFGGVPEPGGPAPVWLEPAAIRQRVRFVRSSCDVVVVHLHWGYEWVMYPLRWHRDFARQLVDDGADIVCCHHAHVMMGVERWGRGVIAHGLGNFYGSRSQRHPLGRYGMVLRTSVDRAGLMSAELVTVRTEPDGTMSTRDEPCPGFRRLCARLEDDDYLARVENARAAYALAHLAADLRLRISAGDVAGLLERQAFFKAPRQEWLLTKIDTADSRAWRRLGAWLRDFRSLPTEALRHLAIPTLPDTSLLRRQLDRRLLPGRLP